MRACPSRPNSAREPIVGNWLTLTDPVVAEITGLRAFEDALDSRGE